MQVGCNATSRRRVAGYRLEPHGVRHMRWRSKGSQSWPVWPRRRATLDLLFSVPYGADAIQVALPGDGLSEARSLGVLVCLSTVTLPVSHELKVWYCNAGAADLAAPVLSRPRQSQPAA